MRSSRPQIAGETELARRRLVRLLVRDPAGRAGTGAGCCPRGRLGAAAHARRRRDRVSTVARMRAVTARRPQALRLPVGAITERVGEVICAIVPDPDAPGRRKQLERALRQAKLRAGLGTTVAWGDAALSFARARVGARARAGLRRAADQRPRARGGTAAGSRPGARRRVRRGAARSAGRALARLARAADGDAAAWLDEQGRLGPAALRLGVHPQTARYRLARLRELFGDALDDPDRRFWLALALRATR